MLLVTAGSSVIPKNKTGIVPTAVVQFVSILNWLNFTNAACDFAYNFTLFSVVNGNKSTS